MYSHNNPNNDMEVESNSPSPVSAGQTKTDHNATLHSLPTLPTQSTVPSTSLDLILAKLNELDAIKKHLTTIDYRLDHMQSSPNATGMVANRS